MGLAWLLFLGSSVHVASTGWLFTNSNVRRYAWEQRGRYVWAPFGLVTTGVILSVVASPRLMSWAVLLVLAWQLHHFQKQNLGQVALTGVSLGLASLRHGERTAICTTGAAGIAAVCAHPGLLQLDVRLAAQRRRCALGDSAPCPRCRWWSSGLDQAAQVRPPTEVLRHVRVGAPLSAPDLRVRLAVCSRRRHDDGARPPVPASRWVSSQPAAIAGSGSVGWLRCARLAVLGGVVLNVMSHLHGDGLSLRLFFGVYLGLLAGHFVVDAGIWRLREPFVRSFLSQRVGYLVCSGPAIWCSRVGCR